MLRLALSILLISPLLGRIEAQSQTMSSDTLEKYISKLVKFIGNEQLNKTIDGFEYKGEWPANIRMRTGFLLLNNPKYDVYDSNCFALAGIHNSLASTFLKRPDLIEIYPMLEKALPRLLSYYSNGGFNFWPQLPPGGRLYMFHKNKKEGLVRRPVQYKLYSPYIRKAANVVNDNDDTSQGLLALILHSKVQKKAGIDNDFQIQLSPLLSFWRDTARASQHWYNIIHFDKRESGAFLTWRALEAPFPSWNIPRLLVNNATFLLPYSTLYPRAFTPYIPYGCNDVDAVVNANVMTALAINGESSSIGVEDAVKFIESKIKRKKWSRAGIYYPNRYNLHYSTLKAYSSGIDQLKPASEKLVDHIKKTIRKDGSFKSRRIVNKGDVEQSSIYALHAMLQLGNPFENGNKTFVEKTLKFLLTKVRNHEDGICIDGGIFFSGGTVIRNTMFWKSDVYSTALFLECLVMYQEYLKNEETFRKGLGKSPVNRAFD